jgi:hypothetical protein
MRVIKARRLDNIVIDLPDNLESLKYIINNKIYFSSFWYEEYSNKMETDKIQTIDEIVEQLLIIKSKRGNLQVALLLFSEDYPTEVVAIKPCIVTNPINISEYIVIFD